MSRGSFTMMDRGGEKSPVNFYAGDITAVSIAGFLTQFGALRTAIEGVTIGTVHKEMWVGDDTILSQVRPATNLAQRETKILVTYQGDTSLKLFNLEIPTADLVALTMDTDGDGIVLADSGPMAAFVTAFEDIGRSPDDSEETVTVIRARHVGRNI